MDRELLKQCLAYHGESLLNKLQCEQTENPDFQAVAADLSKATYERSEEQGNPLIEQFIARKADILFCQAWKTATPQEDKHEEEEEAAEPCAIMPPLELFMEVSHDERRAMLYRDLERGDVVVGRINNIREYGFFLTLLCTAMGLKRDIEDLELSALCHIKEIPSTGSHDDPLSYYQVGDLIRAAVKDIDRFQEKITVSLHQASLPPSLERVKLGVVVREELPVHYSRSVRAAADSTQTYEHILSGCHGYHNPSVVDYLLEKVGVGDIYPPSMMRGLQSNVFQKEDFASVIRKKQSASWALKCVRAGVDHFKHGRHVEAMNEYNKALEIDTANVEALVARGALYANKGSILKAISDFELALDHCPDHRNAKKYLCQTLVERGKQLEEQEKLVTAEGLYRRALSLDGANPEAKEALRKITETIQKSIRLREEMLAKEPAKASNSQSSAEKLRKILKEEKRMKKKRKRSTSSSSSSSSSGRSSSSLSSSSARRRSKKKRKKKHRSKRRVSSRSAEGKSRKERKGEEEEEEEELEWFPAPPNTSATFLNQRGSPGFGAEVGDGSLYSLAGASDEDEDRGRRGREMEKMGGGKKNRSRSPEQAQREWRDRSKDRDRRDGNIRRRSSLDGDGRRRESVSSTEHESSRKPSSTAAQLSQNLFARRPEGGREGADGFRRNSWDGGRYESAGAGRGWAHEGGSSTGEQGTRAAGNGTRADSQQSGSRPKKELPANLLDIFNQIAQFEKEKGGRPKL